MEEAALWRQVIEVKYGYGWGGWCTRSVNGSYRVGLWKYISRGRPSFPRHILYDIGNGSRVKFWQFTKKEGLDIRLVLHVQV